MHRRRFLGAGFFFGALVVHQEVRGCGLLPGALAHKRMSASAADVGEFCAVVRPRRRGDVRGKGGTLISRWVTSPQMEPQDVMDSCSDPLPALGRVS